MNKRQQAEEILEMSALLKRRGFAYPQLYARKLSREGVGPYELEHVLRFRPGSIGSLEYTHGFKRTAQRDPSPHHTPGHHRTKSAPSFATQTKISKKIRLLVREGYGPKQAAAIAYRYYGVARPKTSSRDLTLTEARRMARASGPPIDKARLLEAIHRAGYVAKPATRRRGEEHARMRIVRRSDGKLIGEMTPREAQAWIRTKKRRGA